MSRKKFSALLVSAIVVLSVVALLVPGKTGKDELPASRLLLPALASTVNDLEYISVTSPGDGLVATLERGTEYWTVRELDGYPADWDKVRNLLSGLAQAQITEIKTANPEYYDRLGVEDITNAQAGGILVALGSGDQATRIIIGRQADGRDGVYVRLADSAQSVLSDFKADVPDQAREWADREVTDIAADEVAEVQIIHADGNAVLVRKQSADDSDFSLEAMPEGREIQSSWSVNSLGGVLSALQLDSVVKTGQVDFSEATQVRLLKFSGLEITADAVRSGEDHWLKLRASAQVSDPVDEVHQAANDELLAQAALFNQRVEGWAYLVPAYKFEAMTKRLEDILKPLEEDGES